MTSTDGTPAPDRDDSGMTASSRPSDALPESAALDDDTLAPTSEADGAGTGADVEVPENKRPEVERSEPHPDKLVEGNRVATAKDME
ncbi:hypothetical protein [Schumannella sp. 10F1B-5-1]|uniref:hypothetical protein n=1 Tax=Schumannella sp. 10F1B-5-1 TaxID=2590780 RepID=UPI001130A2A2|nr:hypothetical protein [Schumannella sp. 10F1B-5-1]TPW78336.1 hypothetical protein FJ658_00570 [Schumannella sp. 10F1B-5-1]